MQRQFQSGVFQAASSLQGSALLLESPSDSSEPGLTLSTSQGKPRAHRTSLCLRARIVAPTDGVTSQQRDDHHS